MEKCIIIARVSTSTQANEGISLQELQIPQLKEYAQKKNFHVFKILEYDETASGKRRKHFDEILKTILDNNIKHIIYQKFDRLTRNYRDYVKVEELIKIGKIFHFVEENTVLDKSVKGSKQTEFDTRLFLAKQHINICQEYSINLIKRKKENGEIFYKAPYGYKNIKINNSSTVEIVQEEKRIVEFLFNQYSTGKTSLNNLSDQISEIFFTTIQPNKIHKILTNPFYCGYFLSNNETIYHIYDKIISNDLFQTVQKTLTGKNKKRNVMPRTKKSIFMGLITCSICKCAMTPEHIQKTQKNGNVHKYVYYRCTDAKKKHTGKVPRISEQWLTDRFKNELEALNIPDEIRVHIVEGIKKSIQDKNSYNEDEEEVLLRQKKKIKTRKEKLLIEKLDGNDSITKEEYDKYFHTFNIELDEIDKKLHAIETADKHFYITVNHLLELSNKAPKLFASSTVSQKRELLRMLVLNLSYNGKNIVLEWEKPFDKLFTSQEHLKWGGRRDLNPRQPVPQTGALPD